MGRIATVLMVGCILLSAASFTPTAAAAGSDPLSDDSQTFNASDNVNVWERGILPLRVQTDNADTRVQNPQLFVNGTGVGRDVLGKNYMGVFDTTDTITLEYDADGIADDSSELSGEDVQVIAARVTGSDEGIPNTFSDAIDLLGSENANENATFEFVNENTTLNSDTDTPTEFTYQPSDPGHYIFFVVSSNTTNNDAVTIDKTTKNITVNNNITILGADVAPVERGTPDQVSRTTTNPQPGQNVTFDIDASNQLGANNVTHVLAVYNRSKFRSSTHTIAVNPDELDSDFDIQNNSTFKHSIAEVDGVADVEPGAGVNGVDLSDGRVSRAVGFGAIIDFIAEDANGTAPETDPTGDTILNASIDADVDTAADKNLTIETKSSWETGTYEYVYLGTLENNKSAITTDTGTFQISSTQPFFEVEVASIDNTVTAGNSISVTLNITNTGLDGTRTIAVSKDGTTEASFSQTLGADETTQKVVSLSTDSADTPSVKIKADTGDQSASQTVTVQDPAQFNVNLTLNNTEVDSGQEINGTVNVTNNGGQSDTQDITVSTDGTEFYNQSTGQIAAGDSKEFTFARSTDADDAGRPTITAASDDDSQSALVTVNEPAVFEVDIIESESNLDVVEGQNATLVAEVENTGASSNSTTVFVNNTSANIDTDTVDLDPGEIADVEAKVDTTGVSDFDFIVNTGDGTDRTSVTVREENRFFDVAIDDINESVDEPLRGNTTNITVTATITNLSNVQTTQDIEFRVNGETNATVSSVGDTKTLTKDVEITNGQTPTVDVTVASANDTATETVDVNTTGEFVVDIVKSSNETELSPQTDFAPTINVTNIGEQSGSASLTVRFNDTVEDTFTINNLAAGATNETVREKEGFALNATSTGTKILEAEVTNTDTTESDDTSTRQVKIGDAPNFTIDSSISLTPSGTIEQGNTLDISATINNTGDTTGTQTVTVEFNDAEINASVFKLDNQSGNNEQTISAEYLTGSDDIGEQEIKISTDDNTRTRMITVEENAEFEVTNINADDSVIAGENADVDVTVENVGGNARNTTEVRLLAGGTEVANQSLSLSGGSAQILQFDGNVTTTEAGDLQVTGVTSDDTGTDTIDVDQPGEFEYEVVSVTNPVTKGKDIEVTVLAENVGDGQAREQVSLTVNGSAADTATATAAGGESDRVVLNSTTTSSGTAAIGVSGPTGETIDTADVTVQRPPTPPLFRVSNLDAPASVLETGQTVNVTANVTNIGNKTGTQDITLGVDNATEDTNSSLNLDGDNGTTVDLAFNTSDFGAGTFDYNISSTNQTESATIEIVQPTPGTAEIVSTELTESEASQGGLLEINATIENTGDLDLTQTLELDYRANGSVENTTPVSALGAGNTTTVTVGVTPSAEARAGTFDREVEISTENDTATRTIPVDFGSIQSGVDEAGSGDTVLVASETFQERNTIRIDTSDLTLEAANRNSRPEIQSPRNADNALIVNATGVTVEGLRIAGDFNGTAITLSGDSATVRNVRMQNWQTGILETSGTNTIRGSTIVDLGTGIKLRGDGETLVEFTRISKSNTRGMLIQSDNNTIRGSSVFDSTVGIYIAGNVPAADNTITETTIRGNDDIGVRVRNVQGNLNNDNPSAVVKNSLLESNGVDAFIDNAEVDARSNWWGAPGTPEENVDYIVRSDINPNDALDSRPSSQFDISSSFSFPNNATRDQQLTLSVPIENTGTNSDLQRIELLADGSVVDSTDVELNGSTSPGSSTNVDLSYTPDVTDGENVNLTVRSRDDTSGSRTVNVQDQAVFSIKSFGPTGSVTEGDTLDVTPTTENTGEAEASDTVRLLVNGTQEDTASVSGFGGSVATPTLSYTTTGSDVGDINITIVTSDDSQSEIVTVNEDTSSGSSSPSSPSSSSGGDDDAPPQSVQETIDEVGAQSTNVESVTPTVDAETGTSTATLQTSQSVESITLETTDTSTEVTVTDLDPDSQTDNRAPGETVSLQDITVSSTNSEASDTAATVRFRISNERLEERETTAENLRVFRLNSGGWEGLPTSVAEETANGVILEAQTPGFSVFAVSAVTSPEASLSVNPTTAQIGEDVTLSGVDSSDEDGEVVSYEWSVDGQAFTGETVTVSLDEPGDYTVELVVTDDSGETDTITETLTIEQAETTTSTPAPETDTAEPGTDTEAPPEEPDGFDPIVVVVVVLALLGAALLLYRQQEQQ